MTQLNSSYLTADSAFCLSLQLDCRCKMLLSQKSG